MDDTEKARAHQEALEATSRAGASANRARLWAGLNRYLAAETAHQQHVAEQETEAKKEQKENKAKAESDDAPESP